MKKNRDALHGNQTHLAHPHAHPLELHVIRQVHAASKAKALIPAVVVARRIQKKKIPLNPMERRINLDVWKQQLYAQKLDLYCSFFLIFGFFPFYNIS